jgi:cytidylate kinase
LAKGPVIAIDGPAGAGKSTVARTLAERLGCVYVDSGAMYRAVALAALRRGVGPDDGPALAALVAGAGLGLRVVGGRTRVFLGDEDVTDAVRDPAVEAVVPRVAAVPAVRAALVALQREIARGGGVVMDGRDIGRVVLPDADCKVYLTASLPARVQRRFQQLRQAGVSVQLEDVRRELTERDACDAERMAAAPDAVVLDTTALSVEQVVERIADLCAAGARRTGN